MSPGSADNAGALGGIRRQLDYTLGRNIGPSTEFEHVPENQTLVGKITQTWENEAGTNGARYGARNQLIVDAMLPNSGSLTQLQRVSPELFETTLAQADKATQLAYFNKTADLSPEMKQKYYSGVRNFIKNPDPDLRIAVDIWLLEGKIRNQESMDDLVELIHAGKLNSNQLGRVGNAIFASNALDSKLENAIIQRVAELPPPRVGILKAILAGKGALVLEPEILGQLTPDLITLCMNPHRMDEACKLLYLIKRVPNPKWLYALSENQGHSPLIMRLLLLTPNRDQEPKLEELLDNLINNIDYRTSNSDTVVATRAALESLSGDIGNSPNKALTVIDRGVQVFYQDASNGIETEKFLKYLDHLLERRDPQGIKAIPLALEILDAMHSRHHNHGFDLKPYLPKIKALIQVQDDGVHGQLARFAFSMEKYYPRELHEVVPEIILHSQSTETRMRILMFVAEYPDMDIGVRGRIFDIAASETSPEIACGPVLTLIGAAISVGTIRNGSLENALHGVESRFHDNPKCQSRSKKIREKVEAVKMALSEGARAEVAAAERPAVREQPPSRQSSLMNCIRQFISLMRKAR